jgi:hypothetical protein
MASALIIAITLMIPALQGINRAVATTSVAGMGGVPGGREAGEWVNAHVPEGANLMTIGPSMANILMFYGHRRAYGLSVSSNPLHRNPSYVPIENVDFAIRTSDMQYLVWDSFSASRTTYFTEKLLYYVRKYNGRIVHTQSITVTTATGEQVQKPVIVIYAVQP